MVGCDRSVFLLSHAHFTENIFLLASIIKYARQLNSSQIEIILWACFTLSLQIYDPI